MRPDEFDVVVVDDADDVRAIVRTQLELSGRFNVVGEGGTGHEAIELAAKLRPAVLLLDASMPDMDGLAAIPSVLAASPSTKVVMLSGFDEVNLRDTAIGLGAVEYIEKSAPIRDIPRRLLAVLAADEDAPGTGDATDDATDEAADAVLAAHLERFRTVFEQAAIGMATLTLSGTIVRGNMALAGLLGAEAPALAGRPFVSFAAVEDRDAVAAALAGACDNPAAQELDHRLHAGGGTRWVHVTIAAVRDTEDRPLYLFAQVEDITVRHKALEELRASEERFRLIVESVQDYAIFMLDPHGHVTTWNLGAERLKGYTAEEILGQHFRTFYPDEPRGRRHPERELALAIRDGRYEEEGWRVRKDGAQFWANVVITALFDHEGTHVGFAKVTRDMTERRAAEAAREEFITLTAHELQSPVAAIAGAAEILEDYWDQLDADQRHDTLRRISDGGARIRRLLDELLTASRIEAGTFPVEIGRVELADVVDQAIREVAAVEPIEARGIDGMAVRADPARLVQILTNLLTNAVKYGTAPYTLDVTQAGATVEIRLRDHGPGPAEALVPHLFEKFSKDTASRAGGTGLGLYIVRELARLQQGDAWYEEGPAFVISLPAATEQSGGRE